MLKHKIFLEAIQDTNLLEVTFLSREKGTLTRTCAPMDFGPWRRHSSNNGIRYHFIDLDSTSGQHPLSLTADQILDIKMIEEKFDPGKIIHWVPNWHTARDWGMYS